MAKLLIERGHLAMLFSEEAPDPAKKEAKAAEARAAFTQAHEAYANAIAPLEAALKNYPGYIDEKDPRHAERAQLNISLLDAKLQKGCRRLRAGPYLSARLGRTQQDVEGSAWPVRVVVQELSDADGRSGRADVSSEVLRRARERRRGGRDLQATDGTQRSPAPRSAAKCRLLLHRGSIQAEAVRPGGRRGESLARDLQPS